MDTFRSKEDKDIFFVGTCHCRCDVQAVVVRTVDFVALEKTLRRCWEVLGAYVKDMTRFDRTQLMISG